MTAFNLDYWSTADSFRLSAPDADPPVASTGCRLVLVDAYEPFGPNAILGVAARQFAADWLATHDTLVFGIEDPGVHDQWGRRLVNIIQVPGPGTLGEALVAAGYAFDMPLAAGAKFIRWDGGRHTGYPVATP